MRLPLTGLLGCGLLRVFRTACRLSPFFCVFCSFTVSLFFCILSSAVFLSVFLWRCMFLYCFLPVSFLPLAFILCPTPGCRAYRDPGVMQYPSVSPYFLSAFRYFLSRACAYIIMCPFCLTFHPPLKICSSTCLSISVLRKSFHIPCKKSPYIFGVYVIKSYFCTRVREREQRCFDILTGTA